MDTAAYIDRLHLRLSSLGAEEEAVGYLRDYWRARAALAARPRRPEETAVAAAAGVVAVVTAGAKAGGSVPARRGSRRAGPAARRGAPPPQVRVVARSPFRSEERMTFAARMARVAPSPTLKVAAEAEFAAMVVETPTK